MCELAAGLLLPPAGLLLLPGWWLLLPGACSGTASIARAVRSPRDFKLQFLVVPGISN